VTYLTSTSGSAVGRSDRLVPAGAALGVLGAVLYCDWVVLEPIFGTGLSPVHSYVSELAAVTRPHHLLFNVADIVAGLCFLVLARDVRRHLAQSDTGGRGAISLALVGLATTAGGFLPMTCAPSVQARCPAGGLALHSPLQDQLATAFSVVGAVAVVLSMRALAAGVPDDLTWPGVARNGRRLFALAAPLTVVVGVLGLLDLDVGLPQRALLILDSTWVCFVSVALAAGVGAAEPTGEARHPDSARAGPRTRHTAPRLGLTARSNLTAGQQGKRSPVSQRQRQRHKPEPADV
jgi:hypothetical protein